MSRKQARESAMKLIYQIEINKDFTDEAIDLFIENNKVEKDEKEYVCDSVKTIRVNINKIDEQIEKYVSDWKMNRLAKVDLAILRIAIYEIFYREDIPIEVSINEALETSKKYSTGESSKFINGILGSVVRECKKDE